MTSAAALSLLKRSTTISNSQIKVYTRNINQDAEINLTALISSFWHSRKLSQAK